MTKNKTYKIVVPAHLASDRLPEKVLVDIKGKAMLHRVLDQCAKVVEPIHIGVVTPDDKIAGHVNQWGYSVYRSAHGLPNGTAAIASVVDQLDVDVVINIQADQPLIPPDLVQAMLNHRLQSDAELVTPVYRISLAEDIQDDGVAKVVRDKNGHALYFSRSPIPHVRNTPVAQWPEALPYWGHYGIYGYRRDLLENLDRLDDSYLEKGERLEQLKFLQNGLKIFTFETPHRQLAVDTPEDLQKILKFI